MAAATRSRSRESVIRVPIDHRAASTRHPYAVALDAAVKLAAELVLLEEGGDVFKDHHLAFGPRASMESRSWGSSSVCVIWFQTFRKSLHDGLARIIDKLFFVSSLVLVEVCQRYEDQLRGKKGD